MSSERLITEEDYAAIEGAVMETSRGRWFLAEYARRNRNADTCTVLDAIGRLERSVGSGASGAERLRFDLVEMAGAISRTKAEIASLRPDGDGGRIGEATNELDAIVKATEQATGDILAAAEHLQEVAWTLREMGIEGAACDIIEQRATDIYTACSFQDITGQRTQKVIQVLRFLEDRLGAMIAIWGADGPPSPRGEADLPGEAALLNGPALPGRGLGQSDVDAMMRAAPEGPPEAVDLPPPLAIEPPAVAVATVMAPLDAGGGHGEMVVLLEAEPAVEEQPAIAADPVRPSRSGQRRGTTIEDVRAEMERHGGAGPEAPGAAFRTGAPALESPFSPVNRPRPRTDLAPDQRAATDWIRRVTLADIEALSFEEKAALFS